MPQGLQCLLPPQLRRHLAAVRVISDYAGWRCDVLGRVVRISFVGAVHEAIAVAEAHETVDLLMRCGVIVTVPRSEVGPLMVEQGRDPNPRGVRQLHADWISAVTVGPRVPATRSILLLNPTGDGGATVEDDTAPFDLSRAQSQFGSTHVRVRMFAEDETLAAPTRAPAIVYVKLSFPYTRLWYKDPDDAIDYQGYARESAAYRLVHRCNPSVAPTCHHSLFHEATRSVATVLDDYVGYVHWHGTVSETKRDRHTGDLNTTFHETLSGATRIARALASLHGTFLVPTVANQVDSALVATSENRQALRAQMVHEQIFERMWLRSVGDTDCRSYIQGALYGSPVDAPPVAEEPAPPVGNTPPPAPLDDKLSANNSVVAVPSRKASVLTNASRASTTASAGTRGPGTRVTRHPLPTTPPAHSRLTLIHGDLRCEHVLLSPEPRAVPSVVLVDWKRSAIGPLEVDLLQLYLTLPPVRRAEEMKPVLAEYADFMQVLHPTAPRFEVEELLGYMRDTCLVLAIGGPCPWNDYGRRADEYCVAHRELAKVVVPPAAAPTAW
jgi:hypothetical protein